MIHSRGSLIALVLLMALTPAACVQVRLLTYPAEFVWLDDEDVQGVMHVMYDSMARLDRLIAADSDSEDELFDDESERHAAIEAELDVLEEIGSTIAMGATDGLEARALPRTNHLLIDAHIDDFLSDVARARRFVENEPPNYYPAGQLSGSCTACHRRRSAAI